MLSVLFDQCRFLLTSTRPLPVMILIKQDPTLLHRHNFRGRNLKVEYYHFLCMEFDHYHPHLDVAASYVDSKFGHGFVSFFLLIKILCSCKRYLLLAIAAMQSCFDNLHLLWRVNANGKTMLLLGYTGRVLSPRD